MKINKATTLEPIYTHGGAKATRTDPYNELRRSVLTCMLWEKINYEEGEGVTKRIAELVPQVEPNLVASLAVEAREKMQLRHVPLFLSRELARKKGNGSIVADLLETIVQRPDELTEFLSLYWKDLPRVKGKRPSPLSAGVKRGLARAFPKFSEYSLAKYNRRAEIKLRNVLFLVCPKPRNNEQAEVWKRLANTGKLRTPDTWETELSAGKDKKATFERLLREGKLGGLAVLRNLRNMIDSGVDKKLINERLRQGCERALPFRFIVAAKHAPKLEASVEASMMLCVAQCEKLPGRTLLIIDTSGSMHAKLSEKSEMGRLDAAAGLAVLIREVAEDPTIYITAGNDSSRIHATKEISARRGFALVDSIKDSGEIGHGGIFLVQCLDYIATKEKEEFRRVIVFTDEQDCDKKANPASAKKLGLFNYIVNISTEANGISYRTGWHHIDGWSEHIVDYIRMFEQSGSAQGENQ